MKHGTISIPLELYRELETKAKAEGVATVEELVNKIIERRIDE